MLDLRVYFRVCITVVIQVLFIKVFSQVFQVDFVTSLCILSLCQVCVLRNEYLNHTHHEDES